MASMRKRSKGSWEITYDLPRRADGKRRQKTLTAKGNKKVAEAEMKRIEYELETGQYHTPTNMTVAQYFEKRWLKDYAEHHTNSKTLQEYKGMLQRNILPHLGHIRLSKLEPLQIQEFYTEMLNNGRKDGKGGLSAQTVLNQHHLLHRAFKLAVGWRLLTHNPVDGVEPPSPNRTEPPLLNEVEIATLLEAAIGTRLYIPIFLAVTTGLRRGEICALRWDDLDIENCSLTVRRSLMQTKEALSFKSTKTKSGERSIQLPKLLIKALRGQKAEQASRRLMLGPSYQDNGLICPLEDGSKYPPDRLTRNFEDLMNRVDIRKITFHGLRHLHGSLLNKQKIGTKIISERLGHSDEAFTLKTYIHLDPEMQKEAADSIDNALSKVIDEVHRGNTA